MAADIAAAAAQNSWEMLNALIMARLALANTALD
jgi:hypothetical protein